MMAAIKKFIEMYSHCVKSITCDCGTEFVNQFEVGFIEDTFGCNKYYTSSYVPRECGSKKNQKKIFYEMNEFVWALKLM